MDQIKDEGAQYGKRTSGKAKEAVIKEALSSAGEGVGFMRLWSRCKGEVRSKPNFAYHLRRLEERGDVVKENGLYRLPFRNVNLSDVKFWTDRIRREEDSNARSFAAEQYYMLCRDRIFQSDIVKEYVVPLMKESLENHAYSEVRPTLLRAFCSVIQNSDAGGKDAIKQGLPLETLEGLVADRQGEKELREQAAAVMVNLTSSDADLRRLVDLSERLIRQPDDGASDSIARGLINRLDGSPPEIRGEMRERLFALLSDRNEVVKSRAKELIPRFRESVRHA